MAFDSKQLSDNVNALVLDITQGTFSLSNWLINGEYHYKPDSSNPDYIAIMPKGKTAIATTKIAYMDISNSAKTTFIYSATITEWNALP